MWQRLLEQCAMCTKSAPRWGSLTSWTRAAGMADGTGVSEPTFAMCASASSARCTSSQVSCFCFLQQHCKRILPVRICWT